VAYEKNTLSESAKSGQEPKEYSNNLLSET